MIAELPWEAWLLFLSGVLGTGGITGWWALRKDREDKAVAKAENAPVTAADRMALLLSRVEETSVKAAAAWDRATSAEEVADMAAREARSAIHRAEQAESDVRGLAAYVRTMWVGITTGTVPPHPPIPHMIRHILSDVDFPLPDAPRPSPPECDAQDPPR